MKHINANTKNGKRFVNAYNSSETYSISECYKSYSFEKGRAEILCRRAMIAENGNGFKILSFNTFGFTCAWTTADGLRVETPQNSYIVC